MRKFSVFQSLSLTLSLGLGLGLLTACQPQTLHSLNPPLANSPVQTRMNLQDVGLQGRIQLAREGEQLRVSLQLEEDAKSQRFAAGQGGFRTQAVTCGLIDSLEMRISGIGIANPIAVSVNPMSMGSCQFNSAGIIENIPYGAARIITVTGKKADGTAIAMVKTAVNIDGESANVEISHRTTPVALILEQLINLGARGEIYATTLSLSELQNWVDTLTGFEGEFPSYSYSQHPKSLRPNVLAQAIANNNGQIPASPPADYLQPMGTVNLQIVGASSDFDLVGVIGDPISTEQTTNVNGEHEFIFSNVMPGSWPVLINNGASTRNTMVNVSGGGTATVTLDLNSEVFSPAWSLLEGPQASKVSEVARDAANNLFMATPGGVFHSDDDGASWVRANQGLGELGIHSVSSDVSDTTNAYVYIGTQSGKVYRRSFQNNESEWTLLGSGPVAGSPVITVYPERVSGRVYAGTQSHGLFEWDGSGWSGVNLGLPQSPFQPITALLKDPGSEHFYLVNGSNGVYRTTTPDAPGSGWAPEGTGLSGQNVLSLLLQNATLTVGTAEGSVFSKSVTLPTGSWSSGSSPGATGIRQLFFTSDTFYAATNGGLKKASNVSDMPATWEHVGMVASPYPPQHPNALVLNKMVIDGTGDRILIGTDGAGANRLNLMGGAWDTPNAGLNNASVRALLQSSATDSILYAATDGGNVFRNNDGGAGDNWDSLPNFPMGEINGRERYGSALAARTDSIFHDLYLATEGNGVFCQDNFSSSSGPNSPWQRVGSSLPSNARINSLILAGDALLAGIASSSDNPGLYRLTATDADCSQGIWTQLSGLSSVSALASKPGSPTHVYAGGNGQIHVTTDVSAGAPIWTTVSPVGAGSSVTALGVSTNNPDVVYAGISGGSGPFLAKSTDSGSSFSNLNFAPPNINQVLSIAVDPNNANRVFVGTNRGVFMSADGGLSWVPFNSDLLQEQPIQIPALIYFDSAYLLAGSAGQGLFKTLLGG